MPTDGARCFRLRVHLLTTMTVEEFNTDKGLYSFKFDNVETEFHSHPAIELIVATNRTFTLWTENDTYQNVTFAIIDANQKHKLSASDSALKVIMIEHHKALTKAILACNSIALADGFYIQTKQGNEEDMIREIVQRINDSEFLTDYEERILLTIRYLDQHDLEYNLMVDTLQRVTNLSRSRLSHLFRANLGISLKKYLVWTKLKCTIKQHLNEPEDLFSSLIRSGFYDHPHFSRNFKAMLGVKPSKAYNSTIVQVSPILVP